MKWTLAVLAVLILMMPTAISSAPANVTIVSPYDGNVTDNPNVTFICNATDEEGVFSMSLYEGNGSSLGLYDTKRIMGFQNNSDALLICGFDGSYVCFGGETGIQSGTVFQDSRIRQGVAVNDTDMLDYDISDNINYDEGTIELWFRNDFDVSSEPAGILSVPLLGGSGIVIWSEDSTLYFNFYDADAIETTAYMDISSWVQGQWHHLAVIWDLDNLVGSGTEVDMFVNGSNASVAYDGNFYTKDTFYNYIKVGSYETLRANSLFDELAIYGRDLTPSEINASYNNLIADHTSEEVNWTISNLPDGTYNWNCMAYDNESQTSWGASNYTLVVDAQTPPSVVSVNISPSTEADIDPEVTVNVTVNVTDVSNVSSVILMYKSPYAGTYINDTMDYNTGTGFWENGSIVATTDEGNWTYIFWSNDTWGHAGLSNEYTLPVEKERSWTLEIINTSDQSSSTLSTVSAFKGTEKNMGMLVINNTGDYVANFDFVSSYDFGYNVSEPFDLSPKSEKHVEVNYTFPETPNEYAVTINVTTTSIPSSRSVNGTAISYIGGPYINETTQITSYPVSLTQSSSVNFTASVKNIGNETASNVTLNWTLPGGWSMTYGNMSESLGDLSPYETSIVTVTIYASSSAAAGAATIWINSTSDEGTGGYDFKVSAVSCNSGDGICGSGCSYVNDDDCDEPSTGGGRSSGGASIIGARTPRIDIDVLERIDMTKGVVHRLEVNVTNPVRDTKLTDLVISVGGYPNTLVTKTPSKIGHLNANETGRFMLELGVPAYLEEKEYFVTLTVEGKGEYSGRTSDVEATEKVIFSVHGVEMTETLNAIGEAEIAIEDMKSAGMASATIVDILEDAKQAYANLNFDRAAELAHEVIKLKDTAFVLISSIESLGSEIGYAERYRMSIDESKAMYELANAAFQRGDYERAETRLTAAVTTFQLETNNILPLIRFLEQYWPHVLGVLVLITVSSLLIRKRLKIASLRNEKKKLDKKSESLKQLLRELQEKYYHKQNITKGDYLMMNKSYEKKLAGIISEGLKIDKRIALMKGSGDRLDKIKADADAHIKELQRSYFERGKISRNEYENSLKELNSEIAEIERDMMKPAKSKRKGILGMLFSIAVLMVLFSIMPASSIENVTEADVAVAIIQAENTIKEMEDLGFGITRLNNTLENAREMLARGEYMSAIVSARYVPVLKQKAISANELLDYTELRLIQFSVQGYDTENAQETFEMGLTSFDEEDYDEAERLLSQVMDTLDKMEREALLSRAAQENILTSAIQWVRKNMVISASLSLGLLLTVVIAIVIRRRLGKRSRIRKLEKSREDTIISMKRLQHDYFNMKKMGKRSYETKMERYKNELERFAEELGKFVVKKGRKVKTLLKDHTVVKKHVKARPTRVTEEPEKPVKIPTEKPIEAKNAEREKPTKPVIKKKPAVKPKTPVQKPKKTVKALPKKPPSKPIAVKPEKSKAKDVQPKQETKKISELKGRLAEMVGKKVTMHTNLKFLKTVVILKKSVYFYKASDKTGWLIVNSDRKINDGDYTIRGEIAKGIGGTPYIKLKSCTVQLTV